MALSSGSAAKAASSEEIACALPAGKEVALMRMYTGLQGQKNHRGNMLQLMLQLM